MRFSSLVALLLPTALCSTTISRRDYDTFDYYAVHLDPRSSPHEIAAHLGLEVDGLLGPLDDHYILKARRHDHDIIACALTEHKLRKRKRDVGYHNVLLDSVLLSEKQKLRAPMEKRSTPRRQAQGEGTKESQKAKVEQMKLQTTLDIHDPIFKAQWHLFNTIVPGHDINVAPVWQAGITGKNSTVCIVDDGLDMDSNDLKDNYFALGSFDFNEKVPEPKPRLDDDRHGTRCAGEVAAVRNNVCGVGVAYDAKVAGIRILSAPISDADEAEAMTYKLQDNDIYSCSWGPSDNGQEMGAPGIFIRRAMLTAIQKGRGGKGSIYVFAAGNGAASDDNCNFDGYTNSIYTVTVGAIDIADNHPYYSEKCSAQLVVTYSSGGGESIHTTDVGKNECSDSHGGTSAAGPIGAGIIALALEVRPELTWRDVQWIAMLSAQPIDQVSDWQKTALGKNYSHQFGFGKLDAEAFVNEARKFELVKPQAYFSSPWQHINHIIPEGQKGLASTYVVTKEALQAANLEVIEHVTVTMNIEHTRRGDLSVELRSPTGMISHLSTARRDDSYNGGYDDWTFMSLVHWGETGVGAWTIIVKDLRQNQFNGTFTDWKLNFFGICIDPDIQELLPLPTAMDDADHAKEDGQAHTTSIEDTLPAPTDAPTTLPDDHPHRPINHKPKPTQDLEAEPDQSGDTDWPAVTGPSDVSATPTAFPFPGETQEDDTEGEEEDFEPAIPANGSDDDDSSPDEETSGPSHWFSGLPTFGLSKHTQLWMFAAVVLIALFCVAIFSYLVLARRKRARRLARENYEFEELATDEDDADQLGANGMKKRQQRAGELYNAFASESDEEVFSDDERYRDEDTKQYRDEDEHDEKHQRRDENSSESSR